MARFDEHAELLSFAKKMLAKNQALGIMAARIALESLFQELHAGDAERLISAAEGFLQKSRCRAAAAVKGGDA